jgi:hypothetical protein
MTQPPNGQDGNDNWPRLEDVGTQKEFREALNKLRERKNLTYKQVAEASDDGSGRKLTTTTIHTALAKDALPTRDFVIKFLCGCGLRSEAEQNPWLRRWEVLRDKPTPVEPDPSDDPAPAQVPQAVKPTDAGATATKDELKDAVPPDGEKPSPPKKPEERWRPSARLLKLLAAVTVCAVVAALTGWGWHYKTVDDERHRHEKQVQEQERKFREKHCGTLNPSLVTGTDGECTGITDGSDGAAVFGDDLKPVMTAIGAENRDVIKGGDYVTVAFLAPLASKSANSLTFGQYVAELEGAYTAIEEQNDKNSRPKIRLAVANMGSSEKQWAQTVGRLIAMKKDSRLVAVAGLGLSQEESVLAARALSKASLPMVGDLITADGFDSTGEVDGKGAINGLARVALPNWDQLTAISEELGPIRRTAALVRTGLTPNGSKDLYTESLNHGFRGIEGLEKHLDEASDFHFDPRGGPGTSMSSISEDLCHTGKKIDTVYYAGRVKYLPDFLDALAGRSCHTQPITVITGSDTAGFDPRTKSLHVSDAPITVLYASFRSAAQLRSPANPARNLYEAFARDFTARHHGQQFDADHLTDTYWSLVAHDAVLTAATALHRAAANGDSPTSLPNRYAVGNELFALRNDAVAGATGHFGIDKNGNRTDTSSVVTVHQLGRPLPTATQNNS